MTQLNALMLARGQDTIIDSLSIAIDTDYNLPSAVRQGQAFLILNEVTNNALLTIKASDTTTVETIRNGYCLLIAKQANPITSTHWKIIDVYEEGTWTPTITGSSGAFSSVTYIAQFGSYARVNKRVFIEGRVGWSAATGGSGTAQISSLPYVCNSVIGATVDVRSAVYFSNLDLSAGYTQVCSTLGNGESSSSLVNSGDNLVGANIPVTVFNSGTFSKNLNFSFNYPIA